MNGFLWYLVCGISVLSFMHFPMRDDSIKILAALGVVLTWPIWVVAQLFLRWCGEDSL